jgi:hypothetical protein
MYPGWELVQQVRERRPGLPVLCMTGYSDDQVTRRGLLVPGVPVLHKPFTAEVLVRALREVPGTCPHGTAPGPDGLEPEEPGMAVAISGQTPRNRSAPTPGRLEVPAQLGER